jgi:hypothetical protein
MSHWFKFARKTTSDNNAKLSLRRFAPIRLEALEDRLAPATFNVTTLADGGGGLLLAGIPERLGAVLLPEGPRARGRCRGPRLLGVEIAGGGA